VTTECLLCGQPAERTRVEGSADHEFRCEACFNRYRISVQVETEWWYKSKSERDATADYVARKNERGEVPEIG
jgi:hypothetical protein